MAPRSPDTNPLENLFFILKHRLSKLKYKKTQEEHIDKVIRTFNNIEDEIVYSLCSSFKRRLEDIIRLKGCNTKY